MVRLTTFLLATTLSSLAASQVAFAADVWTDPAPGIRQLVRTAPGPVRYVAVTIDLTRPEYYIRVTRPDERARTTSSWANLVGAVVAINGDWSDGNQPVGLSVGDDQHWPGTADNAWSFMACTLEKRCVFDDWPINQARHHLWREVVGGNGWRLLVDGNAPDYPNEAFYRSDRHPRSGVGLSADGNTMIFAVAEGRRNDSIGVTFVEMAAFFKDLGAHQAMMLDGGGSSTLVLNGARQNQLPSNQGSERVVANHLGILHGGPQNGLCVGVSNGRFCDGSVIHTCQGGAYRGNGDCGAFGASCEVTPDGVGVCVHPFCTGGANGNFCESDTVIASCDYGQIAGSGDCAAFGATCETGADNSYCVHYLCAEGGNATWCKDARTVGSCVDGQPIDDVICADGEVCAEGACIVPETEVPPPDPVEVDPGSDDEPTGPTEPSVPTDDDDDAMTGVTTADGRAGCSTATGASPIGLLGIAALVLRRRRR